MVLSSLRDSGVLQWPLPGDESPGYFLTPLQGYGLSRKKRDANESIRDYF